MKKKKQVICCGNIAFDIIETARDKNGGILFEARPGGSVFNTALQLSRLGISAAVISKIGVDFLGDALLEIMRDENIGIKYLIQDKKIKTGLAMAKIDEKGDPSYIFYRSCGIETSLEEKQLAPSIFKNAHVLHTGSTFSYDDFTFENTLSAVKTAKNENVFVTYDPNWRGQRVRDKKKARGRIKKLLDYIDLLKLSKNDCLGITGAKDLSGALKKLPKNIFVTLGRDGAFFWNGKTKITAPAFKVKVVDTIGAGDAFTAALIYRYCVRGKGSFWEEIKENLIFASAVSALVSSARGAVPGLKNISQVRNFLKSNMPSGSYNPESFL